MLVPGGKIMKTQKDYAESGVVTAVMERAAEMENVTGETVVSEIAKGHAVLPDNPAHKKTLPALAGRRFKTKVNANIGRSKDMSGTDEEIRKIKTAVAAGADFVMDLSVGKGLAELRRALLAECEVPFGTVPIYETLNKTGGDKSKLDFNLFLEVIKEQAEQGVDFMTLHAGILQSHVRLAAKRKGGIVSRGGAILASWMLDKSIENPLYSHWDEVLDICREHDVTVSLGDGLRPGCIADASDAAQFAELDTLGELVEKCQAKGVQVMVEGPGHIPFNQIQENMEREILVCNGAPFYVLGPIVTDIAPGYDHITASIGATAAAYYGASLLCYVTPAEHLSLPTEQEVREGVVAFKIAAHAADVARNLPGARDKDDAMAKARMEFNWEKQFDIALDGKKAKARYLEGQAPADKNNLPDHCSMCGKDFCAVRNSKLVSEKLSVAR